MDHDTLLQMKPANRILESEMSLILNIDSSKMIHKCGGNNLHTSVRKTLTRTDYCSTCRVLSTFTLSTSSRICCLYLHTLTLVRFWCRTFIALCIMYVLDYCHSVILVFFEVKDLNTFVSFMALKCTISGVNIKHDSWPNAVAGPADPRTFNIHKTVHIRHSWFLAS